MLEVSSLIEDAFVPSINGLKAPSLALSVGRVQGYGSEGQVSIVPIANNVLRQLWMSNFSTLVRYYWELLINYGEGLADSHCMPAFVVT